MKSGKKLLKLSRSQWISVAVLASSLGLAAAVTVPFPSFGTGTAISSSQMNANFAALVTAVTAAETAISQIEPRVTRIQYSGTDTNSAVTGSLVLLRTVGTFTKASATTDIEINWNGHVRGVLPGLGSSFCHYQLRIDGIADGGNATATPTFADGGNAIQYAVDSPVGVTASFTGLAAGVHTVSIWLRGSATSCTLNPGNFGQTVLVKEGLQVNL